MKKRVIDIAVVSNLNLGSNACRAEEFLTYLSSVKPAILILTGAVISSFFASNQDFPKSHLNVILKLLDLATKNTEIIYIGNKNDRHVNKIAQQLHTKFKICKGLDLKIGKVRAKFITDRELSKNGADFDKMNRIIKKAIKNGYTHLIFSTKGKSSKQWLETQHGELCVMHSGDWTQSLSTLEYAFKRWKIYHYNEDKLTAFYADEAFKALDYSDFIASLPKADPYEPSSDFLISSDE